MSHSLKPWLIILCNRCGVPNICQANAKNKRCWRCRKNISLVTKKRSVVCRADTKEEAIQQLIKMKTLNKDLSIDWAFHKTKIVKSSGLWMSTIAFVEGKCVRCGAPTENGKRFCKNECLLAWLMKRWFCKYSKQRKPNKHQNILVYDPQWNTVISQLFWFVYSA